LGKFDAELGQLERRRRRLLNDYRAVQATRGPSAAIEDAEILP